MLKVTFGSKLYCKMMKYLDERNTRERERLSRLLFPKLITLLFLDSKVKLRRSDE